MQAKYNIISISLHWLVALTIFAMFAFGIYIDELPPGDAKGGLIGIHKSIGIIVIGLTALRLVTRLVMKAPPLPAATPAGEALLAKATHALLYALMLAVPLSGWIMSNAAGHDVSVFGVINMPNLVEVDKEFGKKVFEAHEITAYSIIALAGFHAVAALYHQHIRKDGLLNRMLPW